MHGNAENKKKCSQRDSQLLRADLAEAEGVITFNASPDWEIPTDYNTNNIYDIRVSVSDGTDTVSQDISVVVLDVDGS